jgi:hypothetical protein
MATTPPDLENLAETFAVLFGDLQILRKRSLTRALDVTESILKVLLVRKIKSG